MSTNRVYRQKYETKSLKICKNVSHKHNPSGIVNAVDLCIGNEFIDNNGKTHAIEQILREKKRKQKDGSDI